MSRLQQWRWELIEKSIVEFNCGLYDKNNLATKHFAHFSAWYYHPGLDLFGPSRFIGFWETHKSYDGWSSGGDSKTLPTYFEANWEQYEYLFKKLFEVAQCFGLKINNSVRFHVPKKEVFERFIHGYSLIDKDINSLESEFPELSEGSAITSLVNKYERDPRLRKAAILVHGLKCMACGFDFEERYGERGKGFIEVHHLKPLSMVRDKHSVNPKTDIIVLCANCHRIVHRDKNNPLSLENLQELIQNE